MEKVAERIGTDPLADRVARTWDPTTLLRVVAALRHLPNATPRQIQTFITQPDEATSALDNETQRVVSDNLAGLGVTRVVMAHRLSTVRHPDNIVVLDHGRVVEQGRFEELRDGGGVFSHLARRQTL